MVPGHESETGRRDAEAYNGSSLGETRDECPLDRRMANGAGCRNCRRPAIPCVARTTRPVPHATAEGESEQLETGDAAGMNGQERQADPQQNGKTAGGGRAPDGRR